ncbi:MAG: hypothetical protein M1837_001570 [Sclerophora amabilis]|nr:MAG: hypothetical protein M1837_001570 [Sclerophora amabilis]
MEESYPTQTRLLSRKKHVSAAQDTAKVSTPLTLESRAARYLDGYPGRDSIEDYDNVYRLANDCLAGMCSSTDLEKLSRYLGWRESAMRLAEDILDVMGLVPITSRWKFDHEEWLRCWQRRLRISPYSYSSRFIVKKANLIPGPGPTQGPEWIKPSCYLWATCHANGMGDQELQERIKLARER